MKENVWLGQLIETITLKPRFGWLIEASRKKATILENSKIVKFNPF